MSSCVTGKVAYATPQAAARMLEAIQRRASDSPSRRATWHKGKATVYRCTHCKAWHIGHAHKRVA